MSSPRAVKPIRARAPEPSLIASQYMTAITGTKINAGTEGWTREKKFRTRFSNRSGEAASFVVLSELPITFADGSVKAPSQVSERHRQ
jgi:hypothetical protein